MGSISIKNIALLLVLFAAAIAGSTAQTRYEVLGSQGWIIPSSGSAAYDTWAANQTFFVGDTLVFNYTTGEHDVAEVTKAAYDNCNATSPISIQTTGPSEIRLTSAGQHYFICTFGRHCTFGQRLAINVSAASGSAPAPAPGSVPATPTPATSPATPTPASAPAPATTSTPSPSPSTAPTPAPAPTPVPSRAPVTYTVGDTAGWVVPSGGAATYQTWASGKTFLVGDVLVFNYTNGTHDVAEVTRTAYDSCNSTAPLFQASTPPVRVTLTTNGDHYYICTYPRHCSFGQQLSITVSGSSTASPSPSPTTTTTTTTPTPAGSTSPPPEGSSATSVKAAGFFAATILSVALALLY